MNASTHQASGLLALSDYSLKMNNLSKTYKGEVLTLFSCMCTWALVSMCFVLQLKVKICSVNHHTCLSYDFYPLCDER